MTQPFQVYVHPQVQLLCDLHSHLCDAEIIGFLAGKYDHNTKILYIQACFPCNSLERTEDNGATDVEMDPIAELSVREVISKYDLDVVGWYHSHPLFRPDPSTTDILNQYQYQQLFKHQSYDSEPFVGLIVSTCDPHLPSFESRHQWFHTIPMMSEKSSTSSPPISKRASKRKKMENETASPAQLYLPMKVEIRVAHVKADRDFSPTTTPDISLLLQEKLLALTHKDIQELEAQLDDDCIFVQTLSCPSNIQRGNLVGDTKCDGHDNDIDLNGNHSLNDSAEVNRGPRKFRPKFRTTESLLTIRQPERMTRSCLKKLNNPSMNESSPRSKTLPEVSDDMTEDSSKKEFDANPTPESFSTNVLVVPAPNTIDSSYPSIDLSESKSERSTPYSKRIRKDSIKKSTDATRLISRRGAQKSTPTESTLKSKETTISHSPVEINTLTLHFFQYFQIADMSASALARSFLCSSPLLLRYTSLCAIALGFYYCSYHRRTNISKKFKADYKYTKIKYSLKVWIRYFGMNDEEQEEYLDNLITFLKYCWLGV